MDTALSEGSSPFFARPKIFSGSVCDSGPVTKNVTMTSSIESVNDISAPDTIAGKRYGTMTSQKAFSGGAPRSIAASSRKGSTPVSRACTATSTNGKQNVVCAMMIVAKPWANSASVNVASHWFSGTETTVKRISKLTPMMTSGMTIGMKMSVPSGRSAGNLYR